MARFLLVHFLGGVATVWGLITVLFLLFQVLPGDPVMAMIDPATASTMPESVLQERRREFGLHLPRWQQYLTYLTRVAQGDLGRSWETREPVARIIGRRLPHTIALATGGMLVAILLGIPTGLIAAAYRNSPLDYAITLFSVVWIASPNFWLALLILYAFAYRLGWFPIVSTGLEAGFLSMLLQLVLPSVAIGLRTAGLLARLTRSSMLEVLGDDFVRTARAKGLGTRAVLWKHALRNALIPVVTLVGVNLGYLLGGAAVIEIVFAREGLGWLIIQAIRLRDYPTFQGAMLMFALGIVLVNLVVDLLYGLIDPRIRHV